MKERERFEKEQAREKKRLEKKHKKERKAWEQKNLHKDVRIWSSQISHEKRKRPPQKEDIWNLVEKGYKIIRLKKDTNNYRTLEEFKLEIISAPVDLVSAFKEILKNVIDHNNLVEGDEIRMVVGHHHNDNIRPLSKKYQTIPGKNVENFILEHNESFLDFIEYKKIPHNEVLISVYWFKVPRGRGRLKPTKKNRYEKKSIITIKNSDSICLSRAIITALANLRKTRPSDGYALTESQLKDGFNKSRKLQEEEALWLHEKSGVKINVQYGNSYKDVEIFAKFLGVEINIIEANSFFEKPNLTVGEGELLYILRDGDHFDCIKDMAGFFGKRMWCHKCKTTYNKKDYHKCPLKCKCCFKEGKCVGENIKCEECHREFFGKECFEEHLRDRGVGGIVCYRTRKCEGCGKTGDSDHKCGFEQCDNCKNLVQLDKHQCYMLEKKSKGGFCTKGNVCMELPKQAWCYSCHTRTENYIFYDFECTQDTDETREHKVNYVGAKDFYGNKHIFKTLNEFCEFLTTCKNYTIIAHNSSGYDAIFIYNWFLNNYRMCSKPPFIITVGTKIIYMCIELEEGKLRLIDSYKHISSSLSDFPDIFNLKEMKKGFFPHLFNRPENENYIGKWPDMWYYDPGSMKPEKRKEFLEWYEIQKDKTYNQSKELVEYNESDVDILRGGCLNLRETFMRELNIDPFQYVTSASVCMAIFRSKFLKENTIAIVKESTVENYSYKSIKWLKMLERDEGIKIKHALNGGEFVIEGVGKVDGYCERNHKKRVFEFQGCFWHGCRKCYKGNTVNPKNKFMMSDLRRKTEEKNIKIREKGYELIELWECDFKDDYSNVGDIVTPLNPRDAFFGGRTDVTKLYLRNKKIHYGDIFSLYPAVNFYDKYPVGHPTKIFDPGKYDENWFGLVKCKIYPPRGLYHPVLPVKLCGKLFFPLCKTCAINNIGKCTHSDEERGFIGTWDTAHIERAIEKNYKVEKVYEVWHFEETSDELFKDYVKFFLKIKIESSHPPKVGPGYKYKSIDHFKKEVKEKLGIEIGDIKYNPGRRAMAKLCLNSLWGKFGQRTNLPHHQFVDNQEDYYTIWKDETNDKVDEIFSNDDVALLKYTEKNIFEDNRNNTNIFIAIFTTAWARLRLYDILDQLGEQVVGYDTDSCWWLEGENTIEFGDSLGDMENELKEGEYITDWVTSGPKSYCYKTNLGNYENKSKGYTLTYDNNSIINFDSMSKLVKKEVEELITINKRKITRDLGKGVVLNTKEEKILQMTCTKRYVLDNYDTIPFGY